MPLSTIVGTKLNLDVEYRHPRTDELVDPEEVAFFAKPPTGPRLSIPAIRRSLGVFHADLKIDASGTWIVGATTAGEYEAPVEDKVFVAEQLAPR